MRTNRYHSSIVSILICLIILHFCCNIAKAQSIFRYPLDDGYTQTSCFAVKRESTNNSVHLAIDCTSNSSRNVWPVYDGKVVEVHDFVNGAAGKYVVIQHFDTDIYSEYQHLDSILVSQGQTVDKNTVIGIYGGTGTYKYYEDGILKDCERTYAENACYGRHLHYMIFTGGTHDMWPSKTDINDYSSYNPRKDFDNDPGSVTTTTGITFYNPDRVIKGESVITGLEGISGYGTLDVNAYLDGNESASLGDYATCNVYLNGELADLGENVADYWNSTIEAGTQYRVVIYPKDGYTLPEEERVWEGTIAEGQTSFVNPHLQSIRLKVNGVVDGVPTDNLENVGTFDVKIFYLNSDYSEGATYRFADDVSSFNELVPLGLHYDITDFKGKNGYKFIGLTTGEYSNYGSMDHGGTTTVTLTFEEEKFDLEPGQWYERVSLPSWVTEDDYEIEYEGHSSRYASSSPGEGWVRTGSGTTTYENSGDVYTSWVELSQSDTRVLTGYYYYHFCGGSTGVTVNHTEDNNGHIHWDQISDPNSVVEVGEYNDSNDPQYKYYKLQWASGGDAYCSSGVTCDGNYGSHGNRSYYWYKAYQYQDRVAGETYYTWVKDTDWQSTPMTDADSITYRFRLKDDEKKYGTLDVNGLLDGIVWGATSKDGITWGTFDVYINDELVSNDWADYVNDNLEEGTAYEIKDIKTFLGKSYNGLARGSLIGTITAGVTTEIQLKFDTVQSSPKGILNIDGMLDGNLSDSTSRLGYDYGTFDVYINGVLVGNDQFDYYNEMLEEETTYEIKDIKTFAGRLFKGLADGSDPLSGSITVENRTDVILKYNSLGTLNVDGFLDGQQFDHTGNYGTFDVYINGTLAADDVEDYFNTELEAGTAYEIKDIKALGGRVYQGLADGSASLIGFITGNNRTDVNLRFETSSSSFDIIITEEQINAVINWANQSRSGYANKCGAFVYDAFQNSLGKTFWSSRATCAYSANNPACSTSMLKDTRPLTYSSKENIPRGALVFYGNDELRCIGHVGIYDGNGKVCDATSSGTSCRNFYNSINSSYCYDSNNNQISGVNTYKGWTTWTGYQLYSTIPTVTPTPQPTVTPEPGAGRTKEDATSWAEQGITTDGSIGCINGYCYTDSEVTLSYLTFDAYGVDRITSPTDFVASGVISIISNEDAGSQSMPEGWNKAPRGAILVWTRPVNGQSVSFIGIARGDGTMVTAMTDYGVTDARIWFFNNNQSKNWNYVYQGWGFFSGYNFEDGTIKKYGTLDLNGLLDGVNAGGLGNFGTADVYLNGSLAAYNINDYYNSLLEKGTSYRIDNIIANDGYSYEGVASGTLTGTIEAETTTDVRLKFDSVYLNVDGYLDGNLADDTGNYGTFSVTVGGVKAAENVNDFFERVRKGADYTISEIKSNNGFSYGGVHTGTLTGTVTSSGRTTVVLAFNQVIRIDNIDINLPAMLVSIGKEAFADCTFITIVIPDGVTSIGEKAFANCGNLKQIDIPVSVTDIANDAFDGTEGLVIYCPAGSDAETFANNHNIACVAE